MENNNFNRRFKMNEEVFIFADFQQGMPHIYKGRIIGCVKVSGIYEYIYQVETALSIYFRFPDSIFKSIEEIVAVIPEIVA